MGVTERSATDWQTKGGISYENAKRLAKLFEVDVDYVWRGTENETPDPFAGADGSVEERLAELADQLAADRQDREANIADVKALIEAQNKLLARQSLILDGIERLLAAQSTAAENLQSATQIHAETAQALDREIQQTIQRLQDAPPSSEPAARKSGRRSSRTASTPDPA